MPPLIDLRRLVTSLAMFAVLGLASAISAQADPVSFTLATWDLGLNSGTFIALATPHGGQGSFAVAERIQTTASSGTLSAWITTASIPERASMVLLGTGLMGFAAGMRRRFRKQPEVSKV
jgi:hypothetical protein